MLTHISRYRGTPRNFLHSVDYSVILNRNLLQKPSLSSSEDCSADAAAYNWATQGLRDPNEAGRGMQWRYAELLMTEKVPAANPHYSQKMSHTPFAQEDFHKIQKQDVIVPFLSCIGNAEAQIIWKPLKNVEFIQVILFFDFIFIFCHHASIFNERNTFLNCRVGIIRTSNQSK